MIKVEVAKAEGVVLDWLVAKCAGYLHRRAYGWTVMLPSVGLSGDPVLLPFPKSFSPSTRGAQGHPIIEREEIGTTPTGDADKWKAVVWCGARLDFTRPVYGPTALVAAMRCYVKSKLGDFAEVPEDLCG